MCQHEPCANLKDGKKWKIKYPVTMKPDINDRTLSLMYPSFALSDFQRPCLLSNLSGSRALAAAWAPPALRLCRPWSCLGWKAIGGRKR